MNISVAQAVHALAIKESADNPYARLGDDGRAVGRYQMHPDWFCQWAKHYNIWPQVDETVDSWLTRLVTQFFTDHMIDQHMTALETAMYFHRGHRAEPSEDQAYADEYIRLLSS